MDTVGAGIHEIVFYVSGSSAKYTSVTGGGLPSDSAITGIVDFIEKDGLYTYEKYKA